MEIDFEKGGGLVPAIIQDAATRDVLMLGYMNREALEKTQREGVVTFFSRSRQCLWQKGETSGNVLHVQHIVADCDGDTLLVQVQPVGNTCHTGAETCFGARQDDALDVLRELEAVVQQRRDMPSEQSYTASLFQRGINAIAQKVGEEAVELVIEAKDDNPERLLNEAADLLFHLLVLLAAKGQSLSGVARVLQQRRT